MKAATFKFLCIELVDAFIVITLRVKLNKDNLIIFHFYNSKQTSSLKL